MKFQDEYHITCPYCGEGLRILIDPSVEAQQYIEDCQVCCQPIELSVSFTPGAPPVVLARHQDET